MKAITVEPRNRGLHVLKMSRNLTSATVRCWWKPSPSSMRDRRGDCGGASTAGPLRARHASCWVMNPWPRARPGSNKRIEEG